MSLPTLGIPKYRITIPSTKKETSFRPFLVKEQKVLYMALESQDEKQILGAMCDIIQNCVDDVPNIIKMPMFDIEYLFTKIRAKSVGEIIELKAKCPQCEKPNEISINLDEVEVQFPEKVSNKIMISDKVGIVIRYPCITDSRSSMKDMTVEEVIAFVANSIETVFDENNVYTKKDFTKEEIQKFVESMTNQQFELVGEFYMNLPELKKEIECKCFGCGHDYKASFSGLQDFFT
jgi:phage FluMu protein Com